MNSNLFSLSDEPFKSAETVISVFKRYDGEVFIDCAEQLSEFPKIIEQKHGSEVLSSKARLFAYNYALKEIDFYMPLIPAENCGKLISDNKFDLEKCRATENDTVKLNGTENYPDILSDIKLGAENGYDCFGIIIDGNVVSAAYAFMPSDMIEDEVEIGVETVEEYQGKGYGSQCVAALSRYLDSKEVDVMYSYYTENTASAVLAEKCGFVQIATGYEIALERGDNYAV